MIEPIFSGFARYLNYNHFCLDLDTNNVPRLSTAAIMSLQVKNFIYS